MRVFSFSWTIQASDRPMSDLDLGVLFDQSRSFHARNLDSESGRICSIIPDLYLTGVVISLKARQPTH